MDYTFRDDGSLNGCNGHPAYPLVHTGKHGMIAAGDSAEVRANAVAVQPFAQSMSS